MRSSRGLLFFVTVALLFWAGASSAFMPKEWMWVTWPYVYSDHTGCWYYFKETDITWCIDLNTLQWHRFDQSTLGAGWSYGAWPYIYDHDTGGWFYINEDNTQWCLNLDTAAWLVLGEHMRPIAGGAFQMGNSVNDNYPNEEPVHQVTLTSFHLNRYEVTYSKYLRVMQWAYDHGKIAPNSITTRMQNVTGNVQYLFTVDTVNSSVIGFHNGAFFLSSEDIGPRPCGAMNWYGAAAFCNFLSEMEGLTPAYNFTDWSINRTVDAYQLPTEAQWEFAARGGIYGQGHLYSGSDNPHDVAWFSENCSTSQPVATKSGNELGLFDMSGNVWEWCQDWFADYTADAQTDPTGPASAPGSYPKRVLRGGAYVVGPASIRCSNRNYEQPFTLSARYYGQRIAR